MVDVLLRPSSGRIPPDRGPGEGRSPCVPRVPRVAAASPSPPSPQSLRASPPWPPAPRPRRPAARARRAAATASPPPPRRAPRLSAGSPRSRPPRTRRARSTSSPSRRTGRTTAPSSTPSRRSTRRSRSLRAARRQQQGRDQRGEHAQGPVERPGRLRPRPGGRASSTSTFAPYKVATWADIPDKLKDANGTWVNDYGGYMSIGYNAQGGRRRRPASPTCSSRPTRARSRSTATRPRPVPRSPASRWRRWPTAARRTTSPRASTSSSSSRPPATSCPSTRRRPRSRPARRPSSSTGTTSTSAQARALAGTSIDWKAVVPQNAVLGSFYVQAINKDAPHPAAARLWEEFLYSDQGQNLWLAGGARPVRPDAMTKAGTVDQTAVRRCRRRRGRRSSSPQAQSDKAAAYLKDNWAKSVG